VKSLPEYAFKVTIVSLENFHVKII